MTATIRTPRLALRPFRAGDAARLVALCDDLRVSGNLARMPHPFTAADAEEFLEIRVKLPGLHFHAACLEDGTLIGCGAWGMGPEHPVPDIAYWLGADYWGQGFGSEIAIAVTADAFRTSRANSITANCRVENAASRRILTSLGFASTGFETYHSRALECDVESEHFSLALAEWRLRAPPGLVPMA